MKNKRSTHMAARNARTLLSVITYVTPADAAVTIIAIVT